MPPKIWNNVSNHIHILTFRKFIYLLQWIKITESKVRLNEIRSLVMTIVKVGIILKDYSVRLSRSIELCYT